MRNRVWPGCRSPPVTVGRRAGQRSRTEVRRVAAAEETTGVSSPFRSGRTTTPDVSVQWVGGAVVVVADAAGGAEGGRGAVVRDQRAALRVGATAVLAME